jgi:aerobic-type carbon monoxide dehydrogenase small subunit (CoxS/CutS family)
MRDVENKVPQGPPGHGQPAGYYNRRDFLKGSSAAAVATALATSAGEAEAAQNTKANVAPAGPNKITLNVNGKDYEVTVEPRTLLLNVLRNNLNLTGCKDVDDRDAAGADTVIIDGKPVLAGSRLAIECVGKKIKTVESLRNGDKVDEVITGFVKHDAMQCGMCTPGFVMATRAFLDKNPKATLKQIQDGLGGNICRCGTYDGITKCALEIAKGGA